MNDYFWMNEPKIGQWNLPYGEMLYTAIARRNDGETFAVNIAVSRLAVVHLRSKEQEMDMLRETMKQLAWGMESYLDPACICRVEQTEECPVRHPRKN